MSTLYLDVTHTFVTGLATGVQRVVRKVTAELLGQPIAGFDRVCPVVALDEAFFVLDKAGIERLLHPARVSGHAPSRGGAARLIARAGSHLPWLMDRLQRRRYARAAARVIDTALERIEAQADDLILLLDGFWGGSASLTAARACRRRGATVVGVAYDMIPATHPGYMTPVAARLFGRRLHEALDLCAGFVAISRTTAAELAVFAQPRKVATEVAYCGCDIVATAPASDTPMTIEHAYIAVGTLEPRKGHAMILDAFEQLWAGGSTARLTFVGRRGWGVDALWQRCRDLMASGAPFRLVDDADDATLAALLAQSSAAIVASEVEGFGLPLVEALNRDLPVIASEIPVFREIASDAVCFFPPRDARGLAEAVGAFERDPVPMREAAHRFTWPTWHDAAPRYAEAALKIREEAGRTT